MEKEREKQKELKRQLMDAGWKIEELRQEMEATRCRHRDGVEEEGGRENPIDVGLDVEVAVETAGSTVTFAEDEYFDPPSSFGSRGNSHRRSLRRSGRRVVPYPHRMSASG